MGRQGRNRTLPAPSCSVLPGLFRGARIMHIRQGHRPSMAETCQFSDISWDADATTSEPPSYRTSQCTGGYGSAEWLVRRLTQFAQQDIWALAIKFRHPGGSVQDEDFSIPHKSRLAGCAGDEPKGLAGILLRSDHQNHAASTSFRRHDPVPHCARCLYHPAPCHAATCSLRSAHSRPAICRSPPTMSCTGNRSATRVAGRCCSCTAARAPGPVRCTVASSIPSSGAW